MLQPVLVGHLVHMLGSGLRHPLMPAPLQVDVANVDAGNFPLFLRVPYQQATLQASEMLYIPKRCWHFMRAVSRSFSVNYWWT